MRSPTARPQHRSSAKKLSTVQIAGAASVAGWGRTKGGGPVGPADNPAQLITAVAIALAESHGVVDATHRNANGSIDRGLWQINSVHKQFDDLKLLTDPVYNAKAALEVYQGRGDFTPWSTFRSGVYRKFMPAARVAVLHNPGKFVASGQGGNWASDLSDAVSKPWQAVADAIGGLPEKLGWTLLNLTLAGTGLALAGYGVSKAVGAKPAEHVKQAARVAAAL